MAKTTVGDLKDRFTGHRRNADGDVVMHYDMGFHILSAEDHAKLEKAVALKLALIDAGLEEPDPISQFAIMVLANTY